MADKEEVVTVMPKPSDTQQQQQRRNSGHHVVNYQIEGEASRGDDDGECGSFLGGILSAASILLILLTFPISIWSCVRMVQEYQRAVIFRLGRVKKGGSMGPGLFFINPCIDSIQVYLLYRQTKKDFKNFALSKTSF